MDNLAGNELKLCFYEFGILVQDFIGVMLYSKRPDID